MNEPWSKRHKREFQGCPYSLSNSFAQPLSHSDLVELALARGDHELVNSYNNHTLEYTPNGGSVDLREEIAKLYGPKIQPENILVFPGAQVALQTAAFAFAADCHSIVFTPGYQSTVESPLYARDSRVTKIHRTAANNWQIDLEQVQAAIQADTRFLILNEPYNPAGTLMSTESQAKLKEVAEKHDIVILCDEVYRLLEHDAKIRLPAMCDFYGKGISCVTLSKPWGGCGITIGWLACQDLDMKQKLVDVQYFGCACPSRASEIQAIMTLRASDVILQRNMQIIRRNVGLLESFMKRYSDLFEWVHPTAGAICALKFKGPLTSEELGEQLAERGISMKPSYCFTDVVTPDIDYFRVGFGEKIISEALKAFEAFVDEHQAAWRSTMKRGEW